MIKHIDINAARLRSKIKHSAICFGGNMKLKIFGTLKCRSGKRMKKQNRVFFVSKNEAIENDYRPCGHCLPEQYKIWKKWISLAN